MKQAGMIELGTENHHLQFTIDLAAARKAGLKIGADLLSFAIVRNAN